MELCVGRISIWSETPKGTEIVWESLMTGRPIGMKRPRLKCPVCGRRLIASAQTCDDGCHVIFSIPPHKPKYWWKKRG